MEAQAPMAILGGGVAGLATGAAARQAGLPFRVYEKSGRWGGNCITFVHGDFRFDSGAHRFHGRHKGTVRQVEGLLGDRLRRVSVPSQVHHDGALLRFPFVPGEMAARLGWTFLLRACGEVLAARLRPGRDLDFAAQQRRRYGTAIAERFLLNYSAKLWGLPADELSTEAAGDRLRGLNALSVLRETLLPGRRSAGHLEGEFFYPRGGIGAIADALALACGNGSLRLGAEVSRVLHDGRLVHAVEVNGAETVPCAGVVSTLPLDRLLRLLDPAPPPKVLAAASFRYRQLALAAFFLDRETVTPAATLYFPEPRFPFTRVYEPRNRCPGMAPPAKTSLVAEVPYFRGGPDDPGDDGRLIDKALRGLRQARLLEESQVMGTCVRRMADAYPVLEKGVESRRRTVFSYLDGLRNLRIGGRNGTFRYLHIHHLLPQAAGHIQALLPLWACHG